MLSAPVILVGRILSSSKASGRRQYEVQGKSDHVQLYEVTVAVENVLKGDAPREQCRDLFLSARRFLRGSPLLGIEERGTWRLGDREMFFLNRDSGVLRTICDFYSDCVVPVFSCADSRARYRDWGQK